MPKELKGAEAIEEGKELVSIDFPEPTEIENVIRAVALWTGKNIILSGRINGKVQIISPKKVTKEEAYQSFLSALNSLGYTTVESGKIVKIMKSKSAMKENLKNLSWFKMGTTNRCNDYSNCSFKIYKCQTNPKYTH